MGKLMFFVVVALGLGLTGYPDDKENSLANFPGDFAGHWALDMPSGWIDVTRQGDGYALKFLWENGSPTPMTGTIAEGVLRAEGPAQAWEGKGSRRHLTLRRADRGISGDMRIVEGDGLVRTSGTFTGTRAPEMPPRPDLLAR